MQIKHEQWMRFRATADGKIALLIPIDIHAGVYAAKGAKDAKSAREESGRRSKGCSTWRSSRLGT